MFKFVHTVHFNCSENHRDGLAFHRIESEVDDELIAYLQQEILDTHPVVFIDAKAELPPHWQTRLLQAMVDEAAINHISALDVNQYQLCPISDEFIGNLSQLDQAIYLLQKPQFFPSKTFNPKCFAVRNLKALKRDTAYYAVNNLVVDLAVESADKITPPKPPIIGDQKPLPAHPLAGLQLKLKAIHLNPEQTTAGYPLLDEKPVALHTVMDWGGGVHKWVNDFIQNHDDMHHLVLSSQGEFYRQQQGESFLLHWAHCDGMVMDELHLSDPIKATTAHHPEYQAQLKTIINRWAVKQLVVSTLIGHAMDCLDTGLPTLRVLHDYFPHWPSLNAQLDQAEIDDQSIKQALNHSADEPFGEISHQVLTRWQHDHNELLNQENITVVAPDQSVPSNLLKLPHSSAFNKTQIIPHALKPIKPIEYSAEHSPFKILVLGRITAAKGQALLKQVIEFMTDNSDIEFILLGSGKAGKDFEVFPQVTVIDDYQQSDLSELLSEHSPQLALLTSVTSETFSYTLSEIQMAGLPVLATAVGAVNNRINSGVNGVLAETDAQMIADEIIRLKQHPDELLKLNSGALSTSHSSIQDTKKAFSQFLNSTPVQADSYHTYGLLIPKPLAKELQTVHALSAHLTASLKATEANLVEKTQWSLDLTEQNKHLTKNIELQNQEVTHLKNTVTELKANHAQEIKQLTGKINQVSQHLDQVNTELNETIQVRDQLSAQVGELSQTMHDVETRLTQQIKQAETQIKEMENSRSWRATQPLRYITTHLRHKRNALKFRLAQVKSVPKRLINSLKSRGIKQTATMAKNKLKKPKPQASATAHKISENYQPLHVNTSQKPLVSVIIPVYNQFKHTYHCLESLARLADKTSFEVIVVDDCSTDETPSALDQITGITNHRQAQNGGFIESCNTGASLAKGQYVLFLNNDTEVLPGWLDELVHTYNEQADVGLVGSQLLYPDGRLQEAGGIVFNDASGWNYGRLDQPDTPEYQHLRQVSYVSGASIMLKKSLFEQLGQFDKRYKPAYYEDTDLAFAVRQAGLKVYYQPLSRVIHFEGISSGTDLTSGTKKYQVINQEKFLAKWQKELEQQPAPGSDIELARFQNQPPRVLIFDACTPTPDQDSGSLRMLNLMKIFTELGYQVSFVPENMAHFENYTKDLQRLGIECVYAPKYASPIEYLKTKGQYFQTIILSRYYVAEPLMPMIRSYCPKAQIWFDTVDLHYLRETRMAELDEDSAAVKTAQQTKVKELGVAAACDLTLVVSPYEQEVLAEEMPTLDVAVLSNIHEIYGTHKGYKNSRDIMFIGGYQHTPNVDGVLWLVEEILPLIINEIPDIKLHIVGSKAPDQVIKLGEHPHIEFHGFVEDIEPLMQNIRIAVAPLRFGAGVKGKVNMSMSYGQPVVGTKVAVEGMYTEHGTDVMMADEVAEFAQHVVQLYQDQTLWEQVSEGGLTNVERWFSFNAAKQVVSKLINPKA